MKFIESTQNKTIKELSKLHLKKERDKTGLFLVEGEHLVKEAYQSQVLKDLYILENEVSPVDIEVTYCTQAVLDKLSNQVSHAKMIGVCQKSSIRCQDLHTALLLDGVQDPGNVGTIIRTAYSFGVDQIYLSNDCCDIYNPKVIQSSQGALFHIPCQVCDLTSTIQTLQDDGFEIYATSLHKPYENLQDIHPTQKFGIVLGNEGQGIRNEILDICDLSIKIEMEQFESLNVAIASSIVLYTLKHK